MKEIARYMPHAHQWFFILVVAIFLYELRTILPFMLEVLSELPTKEDIAKNRTRGKGSIKRFVLFLIGSGLLYGWIFSLHGKMHLDPYVTTLFVVFELLGLRIMMPEQANTLLDKLKSLTNFKPDNIEQSEKPDPKVTTTTTTEVNP
jgi:hypothetical protein